MEAQAVRHEPSRASVERRQERWNNSDAGGIDPVRDVA
jgi:hypothetical protein